MPSFVFYVAFFVAFSLFLYLLQPISHSKRKAFATVAFTLRIYAFFNGVSKLFHHPSLWHSHSTPVRVRGTFFNSVSCACRAWWPEGGRRIRSISVFLVFPFEARHEHGRSKGERLGAFLGYFSARAKK